MITVQTIVNAPIEKVWDYWTNPEHIPGWAFATDDWEAPHAENDVQVGGRFKTEMKAKDSSAAFDFTGTYTTVKEHELLEYDIDDGRHVRVMFTVTPQGVEIVESFDPENLNPEDKQREGWQAFLDNFKTYVEK